MVGRRVLAALTIGLGAALFLPTLAGAAAAAPPRCPLPGVARRASTACEPADGGGTLDPGSPDDGAPAPAEGPADLSTGLRPAPGAASEPQAPVVLSTGAMADGGSATGAALPEASASSAPTPPNGADGSAAARTTGFLGTAGLSLPRPATVGLSPDPTGGAPAVALVGFTLLLLLVAHQFIERTDPRLDRMRDAEGLARFP